MKFSVDKKITLPLRLAGIFMALALVCFAAAERKAREKFVPYPLDSFTEEQIQQAQNPDDTFECRISALMPQYKNYVFSPAGLKAALMLAANGTDGDAQKEILAALGYDDIDTANGDFEEIMKSTADKLALSMWINGDTAKDSGLARRLNGLYGAEVNEVNKFNAVGKINKWCKDATNGYITTASAGADFDVSLINAVYFDEKWDEPFEGRRTRSDVFRQKGGEHVNMPFMHGKFIARLYEDSDVKILEKRYKDSPYAMYFALNADEENDLRVDIGKYLDKFNGEFDEDKYYSGDDPDFIWHEVAVSVPRFKIKCAQGLIRGLETLGIKTVFDPSQSIYIDDMTQSCVIEVDEDGTRAAAVTVENLEVAAVPEKTFIADRPFTFCIADTKTHEILFFGEYMYYEG